MKASKNRDLRVRVIKKYGGCCSRCGYSDWRALQFDHVEGKGNQLTRGCARSRQDFMHEVLAAFGTGKFQLLCANCNLIKKYENGEGVGTDANAAILKAMEDALVVISLC